MKEQIIEFPISSCEMFDGPFDGKAGFCISYQYDMDSQGYGPYGFRTESARRLLRKMFSSLLYWDSRRKKLVNVEYPLGAGLYFFMHQNYAEELKVSLQVYEKAYKLWELRAKYKKNEGGLAEPIKPEIFTVSNKHRISAAFINQLLKEGCRFLLMYSLIPYSGQTMALFERSLSLELRTLAEHECVPYQVFSSFDELKPW